MNSERAFSQGIESDLKRRLSVREACALTIMSHRSYHYLQILGNTSFAFQVFECEEQLGEERRIVEEMKKLLSKAEKRNRALESVLEDERKASEILHVRNEGLNAKLKKLREAVEASVSVMCNLQF